MQWFKTRYVLSLEAEISRLRIEIKQLKGFNHSLTERLLNKAGVPSIELPNEATPKAIEKMMESVDIFEDISDEKESDELTDNRRGEKYDDVLS